jgi:hypothetical protein
MYKLMKITLCLCGVIPVLLSGCIERRQQEEGLLHETRSWEIDYTENLIITSDPPGAGIFLKGSITNYIGQSPVETYLGPVKLPIYQSGSYRAKFESINGGLPYRDIRRTSETNWEPPIAGSPALGWTIQAFLDGYETAEMVIETGKTNAFKQAFKELKVSNDGTLSTTNLTGNNSILITLIPLPK